MAAPRLSAGAVQKQQLRSQGSPQRALQESSRWPWPAQGTLDHALQRITHHPRRVRC